MSVQAILDAVDDVKIDEGTFKYIQIKINVGNHEKIIIRGSCEAGYHADVLDDCSPALKSLGFEFECIGGGRIEHHRGHKTLHVYGYSMGFGKADHTITVEKLKRLYSDYTITWSNEGY